jgi:hypothetical protein
MTLHLHAWQLRDDGKYECRCGRVRTKRDLAYRTQIMLGKHLKISSNLGIIEVEGTRKELIEIYERLIEH